MIPYAILTGTMMGIKDEIDIRILDLNVDCISFRLHPETKFDAARRIILRFYRWKDNRYDIVEIPNYTLYYIEHEQYWTTYHIKIKNDAFHAAAKRLMTEYSQYIQWKLYEEDAVVSQNMTGYPARLDDVTADTAVQQRKNWTDGRSYANWNDEKLKNTPLGLVLQNTQQYKAYLRQPLTAFQDWYWEQSGFAKHPLRKNHMKYLYIGSQFCHMQFPEASELFAIVQKAYTERLIPVIQFPYMQEDFIEQWENTLNALEKWCEDNRYSIELVVNDWGMLQLLQHEKYRSFQLTLGVLLNKRRKDTRIQYKNGFAQEKEQLCENAANAVFYQDYLHDTFNVQRISSECCGYRQKLPDLPCTLYWPYYQMNTSQHCTMYAACRNGARGKQELVTACPQYCETHTFLYPDHLHMIGYGNSLFGIDLNCAFDGNDLQDYVRQTADRLVVDFL